MWPWPGAALVAVDDMEDLGSAAGPPGSRCASRTQREPDRSRRCRVLWATALRLEPASQVGSLGDDLPRPGSIGQV